MDLLKSFKSEILEKVQAGEIKLKRNLTVKSSSRLGCLTRTSLSIAKATTWRSSKFKNVLLHASDGTCCRGTNKGALSKDEVPKASSTAVANLT